MNQFQIVKAITKAYKAANEAFEKTLLSLLDSGEFENIINAKGSMVPETKKGGRPSKSTDSSKIIEKKKRGRPAKIEKAVGIQTENKKRGRPAKNKAI